MKIKYYQKQTEKEGDKRKNRTFSVVIRPLRLLLLQRTKSSGVSSVNERSERSGGNSVNRIACESRT